MREAGTRIKFNHLVCIHPNIKLGTKKSTYLQTTVRMAANNQIVPC
jgi:hypothetical protein